MGRVRSAMIKKAARQLYESEKGFTEDFDYNKKLLKGLIYYKSMRNRVAGCIVGLVKKANAKPKVAMDLEVVEDQA